MTTYGLWCTPLDMSSDFLDFLVDGKINRLIVLAVVVTGVGTTVRSAWGKTPAEIETFKDQVKAVRPGMKFIADVVDGLDCDADQTTSTSRTALITSLYNWFTGTWDGVWDGIQDDTEHFLGTVQNHMDYYNEAYTTLSPVLEFYCWLPQQWSELTTCPYQGIGLYTSWWGENQYSTSFPETPWKECWDAMETSIISQFGTGGHYHITLYCCGAELPQQIPWLIEKLNEKSWDYLESIDLWWYQDASTTDKNAWIDFVATGPETERYFEPEKRVNDPSTSGWGATEEGRIWYNTTLGKYKYWNGSAICVVALV